MGNMSYCRFSNTASDLRDCLEHIDTPTAELSKAEAEARISLVRLCKRVVDACVGDDDTIEFA